jgi:decaprenylphospho-beta-D-erythro-pentofuranosid-2-ulose 2-reductase
MRVALLGATRGMGKELARRMAERGDALCLLGRDPDVLAHTRADLAIRQPQGEVHVAPCDLLEPASFAPALDAAEKALGGLDTIVVSAGLFADQLDLERDAELRDRVLMANFVHTVHFCELARARLLAAGGGTLCVFSSVAGERARTKVRLYGAAKAGLSHYLEGLDHAYRRSGLRTVAVKPGFVRTGMTAHLPAPPFAGEPDAVAERVLRAIDAGEPEVYVPSVWRWIMWVIRQLPRAVMRRLEF